MAVECSHCAIAIRVGTDTEAEAEVSSIGVESWRENESADALEGEADQEGEDVDQDGTEDQWNMILAAH